MDQLNNSPETSAKIMQLTKALRSACKELGHTGWHDDMHLKLMINECIVMPEHEALRCVIRDYLIMASKLCSNAQDALAIRGMEITNE